LWQPVDSREAWRKVTDGATLIDARPAGDFNAKRIRGALKMPAQDVDFLYSLLQNSLRQAPAIVIYGRTFSTFPAATVGQYLRRHGLEQVYVTQARLAELEEAGFALQEPRRRAQ
jgi:rhodanese-related sulfurtransferase